MVLTAGDAATVPIRAGARSQGLGFGVTALAVLAPVVRQPQLLPAAAVLIVALAAGVAVAPRQTPVAYPRGLLLGLLTGFLGALVVSGAGLAPGYSSAAFGVAAAFGAGVDWCRPASVRVATLLSGVPVVVTLVAAAGSDNLHGLSVVAFVWFGGALAVLWSLERDGESAAPTAHPVGSTPAGPDRSTDLVRIILAASAFGVLAAMAAGVVAPPPAAPPPGTDRSVSGAPGDGGTVPASPSTEMVTTLPDVPDPPVTVDPSTPADPVDPVPEVDDTGPILQVVAALAALLATLWLLVRRARRARPAITATASGWRSSRGDRRRPDGAGRRRRRSKPLGPPWAEDLRRRIEREGARRGRARGPAESLTAYTEALAAGALPDPRLPGLGAALSAAYFGPDGRDGPGAPPAWATVLDEMCAAHPAPGRSERGGRSVRVVDE